MRKVFTLGVFDMLHVGHVRLLERAKMLGDELIVGIVSDKAVKAQKGDDRPVVSLAHRAEIVSSLKCVDKIIEVESFNPFKEYDEFRKKEHFDNNFTIDRETVHIVVKGEDQAHLDYDQIEKKYAPVMVVLQRTKDVSTTNIITRLFGDNK